ncbi:MAG TPA: serine/threonine-protein kinase [Solirubrobacteraceae bacterium]|nr:serine/threonine-protein kinase [Solirubrobacteraceae bacterium]
MERSTEIAPGSTLHGRRYRLERVLGTGGMASVWLAQDERLQRPVAVKVMADTLAGDPDYVRRFKREARIAARLSHPNLVDIFDFSAEGERPFLVMEYVAGGSLAQRMHAEAAMPIPVDVLARDLLGALGHVHAAGIVHRDIKPANVLVDEDQRPRLTDFGIAHPDDATHLTITGQVVGTLKYLAPEIAAGEPATPRSDLYSCGILLRDCGPDGARLGELIELLTEQDPERRPASARAAIEMLSPTAPTRRVGDSAAADTAAPTEATRRLDPTAPTAPTAATAPVGRRTQPPTPPPAAAAPSRRRAGRAVLVVVALLAVALVVAALLSSGGGRRPGGMPAPRPAPQGASLDRQLDALQRIVRQAGR